MSDDGAVHRHVPCIRVLHQNTIITIIVDVINAMDMAALTKSWTALP
jgi:hypothetical protein